ncbi:23S rRNA (uracil(1939)-C(5))-methyltransferase RlmD [Venatoribacter cucullus]|uniref:23S rRNA (uracil(1939)-C(5))-methyltransferase RlmD n=1 Tax=Venatoribacter cucullus TaxID=2661630 RepID=UPI0022400940|nr:23S rRNA (uracil(1939)-C(5))-methyltransferase RlmD [Venatoribacter cucullus]
MKPATSTTRLTLAVDNLTSEGEGVARRNRDIYFVPGALPGETVEVVLNGRRRQVWQTRLLSIQTPSPQRTEPLCPHYQRCGGCDLQHLQYPAQLGFKQERVAREFSRQNISVPDWQAPIQAEPWHYRRKARLGVRFSQQKGENFVGFREAASAHLTNIDECLVLPAHPALNWAHWREQLGQLQGRAHITQIEVIVADNALALVLRILKPLSAADQTRLTEFAQRLQGAEKLPLQLWLKTDKQAAPQLLWPALAEPLFHRVDELALQIQPDDFIQVNGAVNRAMVQQALDWLQPQPDEVIWDLFAGHGNFSMPLAKRSQQVWAVEGDESMVTSLQQQAQQLQLPLQARCADLSGNDGLRELPDPAAVLLDPPRAGAAGIMQELLQRQVPRILYVACDAATQARDLNVLVTAGYQVVRAGIMDMFPQTHHVETMVLLERKAKRHG